MNKKQKQLNRDEGEKIHGELWVLRVFEPFICANDKR